ncbi:YoaK family protein [Streptomyces sp. NPDC002928]|uniref:YoaK family protein n=1 Tax=Streptomyces sp. NPDC002928 TaxID=3154440 RepID=UPI0033A50A71
MTVPEPLPTSQSVRLGVLLAMVGGALDAYTFVSRGGVFACAQTANVVLLGIEAAHGQWWRGLTHVPPILAFVAGVLAAESLKHPRMAHVVRRPTRAALVLEVVVLAGVGLVPAGAPDILVTVLIAFTASVQITTFRKLVDTAYNSTMTTGNLRTATQSAYEAFVGHDGESARRGRQFTAVIVAFMAGALGGAALTTTVGVRAVWAAAVLLFCGLALFVHDERTARRKRVAAAPTDGSG